MKGKPEDEPALRRPVAALGAGFGVSALAVYAAVATVGSLLRGGGRPGTGGLLVAAVVVAVLAVVDTHVLGLHAPMWRRQTPRELHFALGPTRGALVWGLDTGLVVTTFRVTSLSWTALTLSFLGLLPWWAGLAYAAGFILPSAVLILLVPRSDPESDRMEPIWLMELIGGFTDPVRLAAIAAQLGVAAWLVGSALA